MKLFMCQCVRATIQGAETMTRIADSSVDTVHNGIILNHVASC